MDAFTAANSPGRGSDVGDFVPGKKGGWVPKNHPDAIGNETPGTRVDGGPDVGVGGGLPPGTVGANAGEAGPSGPAMAGLASAAGGNSGSAVGVREMAPPGAGNPQLGQRIYPVAMRQLSLLPRAY
jgi:hypothetical protein